MNKKNYIWFNIPESNIDGYKIWLSAPNQDSANETLKIMKNAKDLAISTSTMKHIDDKGKLLRNFNIILN